MGARSRLQRAVRQLPIPPGELTCPVDVAHRTDAGAIGCPLMGWLGRITAAGAVIAVGSLASCALLSTSEDPRQVPQPAQQATRPADVPSMAPTPTSPPVRTSPLTGLPEPSPRPVLIVKLDNTRNAQPHAGLRDADVVYIEEVEYGITRIAAVFSSTIPTRIGPVRSARITDIDLLAQYGSPAFAFSGAQHKLWPALDKASFIDISPNKAAKNYVRDYGRRAPYNYFLDGQAGLAQAPDASMTTDMGWVFQEDPPAGGLPVTKARMEWSYASASFAYDEPLRTYKVHLNGVKARAEEDGRLQHASTVVIQYVDQNPSVYFDKGGGNTPQATTIGSGQAIVLRDGRAWNVTWSRPNDASGTTFTLADGSPMPFKPGQTWVVLLDNERTAYLTDQAASPTPTASSTASASSSAGR